MLLRAFRERVTLPRFTDPILEFHWPVCVGFAAICFAVSYPGRLNQDSLYAVITMTSLGELGNWHSATLGWLWSLPGALLGQPAGALLMQSVLLGLFAGFLPRVPPTVRGWLTLSLELVLRFVLAGSFGSIGKDVAVLGAMLILVQLLRYGLRARLSYAHGVALAFLAALILLVKAPNFLVFVLCVALLLPFLIRSLKLYGVLVAIALLLGGLAVPLNRAVDRSVFEAKDMHPDKQLVIFDLAAISLRTGTNAFAKVPGWPTGTLPPIGACFLPHEWDTFAPWGSCSGYSAAYDRLDRPLTRRWAIEIVSHPVAYAGHRLTYVRYLLGSRDHSTWGIGGEAVNDAGSPSARAVMQEMLQRLKANRPVQLWWARIATMPFQWLESRLLKFPNVQSAAFIGLLTILLLCWLRRREGVRLGALLPAGLGLGNFGMLVVFGVADPGRYFMPTTCLFYVALLALLVPGHEDGTNPGAAIGR